MEELRRRCLKDMAGATAYLTFFFVKEPDHRGATWQFVREGVAGMRRPWQPPGVKQRPIIVPRWRTHLARLYGPIRGIRGLLNQPSGQLESSPLKGDGRDSKR